MKGIDFASGRPSVSALKAAGAGFVGRYLSGGSAKDLTLAEKNTYLSGGIAIILFWETAGDMSGGASLGKAHAAAAAAEAKALGLDGIPVYFTCDKDPSVFTAAQWAQVDAYLGAAASVLGLPRVGGYGGYDFIKHCFDKGKVAYGCQTYAWSKGRWDTRAQLRQVQNNVRVAGITADWETSTAADFGQWPRPSQPPPSGHPVLQAGSLGDDVKLLQHRLNAWGASPALVEDGDFGLLTGAALRSFQAAHGLTDDGIAGPLTWAALDMAPPAPARPPVSGTPDALVSEAVSFLGYREGVTTPFGVWYAQQVGDPAFEGASWCDMFVSYCGAHSGCGSAVGMFAFVPYHKAWFQSKGIWHAGAAGIQRGDIAVFNWNADSIPDHIGIVESVGADGVHTVEGNTGNPDGVYRMVRQAGVIDGYGRPVYSQPAPEPVPPGTGGSSEVTDMTILGPGKDQPPVGVSFTAAGEYTAVNLMGDVGIVPEKATTIRVAAHHVGGPRWAVSHVTLDPDHPRRAVNLPPDCDGCSFTREDDVKVTVVPVFKKA